VKKKLKNFGKTKKDTGRLAPGGGGMIIHILHHRDKILNLPTGLLGEFWERFDVVMNTSLDLEQSCVYGLKMK
jgi:hypothetical protein